MHSSLRLHFEADLKNLAAIRNFVEDTSRNWGSSPEVITDIIIAVNEAATNIILHGYKDQQGNIEIEMDQDNDAIVVYMRDQAPRFDPTTAPAPDLNLQLEQRSLGGMGIYMMRQLTDEMIYQWTPNGKNELILKKKNTP